MLLEEVRVRVIVHGILQARVLEWVAFPFSRGSSQPRRNLGLLHYTQLSAPGKPPGRHQGIELGSPALQADSLPAELPGKPRETLRYGQLKFANYTASNFQLSFVTGIQSWKTITGEKPMFVL